MVLDILEINVRNTHGRSERCFTLLIKSQETPVQESLFDIKSQRSDGRREAGSEKHHYAQHAQT